LTSQEIGGIFPNKVIIEVKPKQGTWYDPFIGYPASEKEKVGGYLLSKVPSTVMYDSGNGMFDFNINGKRVKYFVLFGKAPTLPSPEHGYLIICNSKPSQLIFGDKMDSKKVYKVDLM
jgi:hypothetical protein